ncbi:SEP domain [Carpediemonas membranifera]|uniref:SEP domain n=1 Tax=Carpediemonas membranifera TaxID=201153 RepID=A0A8J6AS97_9EUKA|nr:SEP domain [Carpediemonas membranifera]|eukprot:KAG9390210.1 SEP domain [Carpediemonas membranifera]
MISDAVFREMSVGRGAPARSSAPKHGNDADLLTMMTSKLRQLEAAIKKRDEVVRQQNDALARLRRENEVLKIRVETADGTEQLLASLQRDNAKLKDQVGEMEVFLRDYGLVWVGGDKGDIDLSNPDFITLGLKLRALNDAVARAGGGQMEFEQVGSSKEKRLVPSKGLKIRFYVNGFIINTGPFRPYADDGLAFIGDLMDGYFPSELKEKYPDGTLFDYQLFPDDAMDPDTLRSYKEAPSSPSFKGRGNILGKGQAAVPANVEESKGRINPKDEWVTDGEGRRVQRTEGRVTKEEFMARLPASIIRNGVVVPVREEIGDMLVEPVNDEPAPPLVASDDEDDLTSTGPLATIRARLPTGNHVLTLPYAAPVGRLYKACERLAPVPAGKQLELRVPGRGPVGRTGTLESEALVPSAVVMAVFVDA